MTETLTQFNSICLYSISYHKTLPLGPFTETQSLTCQASSWLFPDKSYPDASHNGQLAFTDSGGESSVFMLHLDRSK